MTALTNWAGSLTYVAARFHEPSSLEQLQEIVRGSRQLRLLGSRHSFNDIADTRGDLVSLARLPRRLDLDPDAGTLTVDGGVRYGDVCVPLDAAGFALHNLASLPHISVAGACSTGTHGSGDHLGSLATAVRAVELVRADGQLVRLARDVDAAFPGAVVALGSLGAVSALTLDLQPAFQMRQDIYEGLALDTVLERFDEITASADSVSLFTDWTGPTVDQLWLKRRVDPAQAWDAPPTMFGARRLEVPIHPIRAISPEACTPQLGVPGPWFERMPHFRMDHTPSSGAELQTEYLVAREHATAAIQALDAIRERISPILQISEIRTIAADDLWLSMAYARESVALHFTWRLDWRGVHDVLPAIEAVLAPFEPRPHWGKVFTLAPDHLQAVYPRLPAFRDLVARFDPDGVFRNSFLERTIL